MRWRCRDPPEQAAHHASAQKPEFPPKPIAAISALRRISSMLIAGQFRDRGSPTATPSNFMLTVHCRERAAWWSRCYSGLLCAEGELTVGAQNRTGAGRS